jgi:hypothetical protein
LPKMLISTKTPVIISICTYLKTYLVTLSKFWGLRFSWPGIQTFHATCTTTCLIGYVHLLLTVGWWHKTIWFWPLQLYRLYVDYIDLLRVAQDSHIHHNSCPNPVMRAVFLHSIFSLFSIQALPGWTITVSNWKQLAGAWMRTYKHPYIAMSCDRMPVWPLYG